MEKTLLWSILFTLGWALSGASETDQEASGHLRQVPRVVLERTFQLASPRFEAEAPTVLRNACGIECQEELPAPSLADLEESLSYETVFENGTRTLTRVRVQGLAPEEPAPRTPNATAAGGAPAPGRRRRRRKRQVYGTDSRFSISGKRFLTSFPFSTAVKLSTGCSGVLVSPRHVLTAAHCVHDGRDYVRGSRRLRVGLLKVRRRRGGQRRRGARRGRREATGEDRRGSSRPEEPQEGAQAGGGRRRGRRKKTSGGPGGPGRGAEEGRPSFQWTRVQNTRIPKGWTSGEEGAAAALDYDYALLELKRAQGKEFMELGVSPALGQLPGGGRIHFSGFDRDRADQLVYRFCGVAGASRDLLYQRCDAAPGAAGSGVYLRLRRPGARRPRLRRTVVAVHAGHQRVDVGGRQEDFNVAVRITPLKLAQICLWMHGQDADCGASG